MLSRLFSRGLFRLGSLAGAVVIAAAPLLFWGGGLLHKRVEVHVAVKAFCSGFKDPVLVADAQAKDSLVTHYKCASRDKWRKDRSLPPHLVISVVALDRLCKEREVVVYDKDVLRCEDGVFHSGRLFFQ